MHTCGYCSSQIKNSYCDFCDMELGKGEIQKNGCRIQKMLSYEPDQSHLQKTTRDLMKLETIELLFLLKYARENRSNLYKMRVNLHRIKEEGQSNEDLDEMYKLSYLEYENVTKKVWSIENIIKGRIGYYPKRLSDDFIEQYLNRIRESDERVMLISKKREKTTFDSG